MMIAVETEIEMGQGRKVAIELRGQESSVVQKSLDRSDLVSYDACCGATGARCGWLQLI